MNKNEFETRGRSMRWYEWLLLLLLLGLVAGVRAESVYKCTDAGESVAYQSKPCPAGQEQIALAIDTPPAYAPPPRYAVEHDNERAPSRSTRIVRTGNRQAMSYECHASDGEVFYRFGGCPHSIAGAGNGGRKQGRGHSGGASVSVSARPIPREEACAQMHRAGSVGRAGHEHDEDVSTYERDLGNDPCR